MALTVALMAGGSSLIFNADPADAQVFDSLRNRQKNKQTQQAQQEAQPAQTQVGQLDREENAAILPLYQAVEADDWAAARAAVPAAQAGARTPYGRYVVAQLQLEIGRGTNDQALQVQAVNAMVASGGAPAEILPQLLSVQAGLALQANDFAAAESALTRLLEANPNDVARIAQLAQVKSRLNKRAESLTLMRRALELGAASGQRPSEDLYKRALAVAYEGRMTDEALAAARELVTAYPSPTNWRDALVIYRELGNADTTAHLDLYRLMRAAGALTSERDYVEYAEAANRGAMLGEVKAVLQEGLSRNAITGNAGYAREMLAAAERRMTEDRASLAGERTSALAGGDARVARRVADSLFGYGQYAEAAELYRAALDKGGEDTGLLNLRLGAALAQAGRRADAEAAFRAVQGPRAGLADFWLLWLASRG